MISKYIEDPQESWEVLESGGIIGFKFGFYSYVIQKCFKAFP